MLRTFTRFSTAPRSTPTGSPPLPAGMAWTDLSDSTTLERFLDEPAVEGCR
jgi:hypothetical protein